jgi:GTP-binding protein HflX
MFEIRAKDKMTERALLVGAYIDPAKKADAQSLLEELEELVDTLGIPIIERRLISYRENHARYLIGSGKAQEIVDFAKEHECDVLIFDNELSPSQQRNWEELSGLTVADRHEIILDIFGARAQTREARIQGRSRAHAVLATATDAGVEPPWPAGRRDRCEGRRRKPARAG